MPLNFNPQERNSLVSLLSALQGGLPGSQGYGLLQDILGQQQQRVAQRQERMGSLIDLLVNGAAQGQSYEAAQALAGAYTNGSNMPPRIEDALGSLYPGGPGTGGATFGGQNALPAMGGNPDAMSPVYQPQPMSPQDQLAYQELQQNDMNAQATQKAAPMIATALADQAMALLEQGHGLGEIITDPMIQELDPTTRAFVLQEIQARIDQAQQQQPSAPGGPRPTLAGSARFGPGPVPAGLGR